METKKNKTKTQNKTKTKKKKKLGRNINTNPSQNMINGMNYYKFLGSKKDTLQAIDSPEEFPQRFTNTQSN